MVPRVIGTYAFVAAWVIIGLGLLLVALRGGSRGARGASEGPSRGSRRAAGFAFAAIYIAFGVAIPALAIGGSRKDDKVRGEGVTLTSAQQQGRILFGERCGSCHVLKSANSEGRVGPNLDELLGKPPAASPAAAKQQYDQTYAFVMDAILNGRQRGNGTMPALVVTPQDAPKVAAFVAATAGK